MVLNGEKGAGIAMHWRNGEKEGGIAIHWYGMVKRRGVGMNDDIKAMASSITHHLASLWPRAVRH